MIKRKVLAIDDDPSILEMLRYGLESLGYAVETAEDEASFRASLARSKPDVILMDVQMPGTDGIRLCRDMKLSPEFKHVPVIMLTALADPATRDDACLFGARGFIAKPFEMTDVHRRIEEILQKTDGRRG